VKLHLHAHTLTSSHAHLDDRPVRAPHQAEKKRKAVAAHVVGSFQQALGSMLHHAPELRTLVARAADPAAKLVCTLTGKPHGHAVDPAPAESAPPEGHAPADRTHDRPEAAPTTPDVKPLAAPDGNPAPALTPVVIAPPAAPVSAAQMDARHLLVAQDSQLLLAMNQHSAHLQVDTAGHERVDIQLHVKHGVIDVTMTGNAAPQLVAHAQDLSAVLGKEGLQLGNFELGSGQPDTPDRDDAPRRQPRAEDMARPVQKKSMRAVSGRVHVKA